MTNLFTPTQLGSIALRNRVVMAPMTRSRSQADGTPTDMMVDYYRQRAGAGLIIAEGTYPSENGKGYCRTPGIVNQKHIDAWAGITEAVHAEGGKIVLQIMHCGRCSHADNKSPQSETVAPSAINAEGEVFTEADTENMIAFAEEQFGALHILFNNAGIMHSGDDDAVNTDEEIWDLTLRINFAG